MHNANNDKSWPHQQFHDANSTSNEASRSSQVYWSSRTYHYLGTNIEITQKEGRGVLKQPGSSINIVIVNQIGIVRDYFHRQY